MTPDVSAFYTAAVITLMGCCWLMTKLPGCNHETCKAAHDLERGRERKAEDAERRHMWHDRFRPQAGCALCDAKPPDPEP